MFPGMGVVPRVSWRYRPGRSSWNYVFRTFFDADRPVEMGTQAPNSYLRNAILQATPERLQLMLFDGAIRYAAMARLPAPKASM